VTTRAGVRAVQHANRDVRGCDERHSLLVRKAHNPFSIPFELEGKLILSNFFWHYRFRFDWKRLSFTHVPAQQVGPSEV
jgi:hypothetical protein